MQIFNLNFKSVSIYVVTRVCQVKINYLEYFSIFIIKTTVKTSEMDNIVWNRMCRIFLRYSTGFFFACIKDIKNFKKKSVMKHWLWAYFEKFG